MVERLSRELEGAKENLKNDVPVPLQNAFYQSDAVFDEALNYFSAENRNSLEEVKTELHLLIGPFPVQNAEKIRAIMKDGYLEVKTIEANYEIEEAKDESGIKLSWKPDGDATCEAHHDVLIDATGQKAAFEKHFSPLTTYLRKAKLIKEILVTFRNANVSQHHEDHLNVVPRNGVNHFRPSSNLIDINNFSMVQETEDPSLPMYYMGPFTMGQVAFPQDLRVVTTAAERAVADLIKRGMLERDVNYEVEHDPTPIYG